MESDADQMQQCVESHEAADRADARVAMKLTLEQRGAMLMSACRSAAAILRSRRAAGLPADQPAPWPESTWQFLKTQAQNARRTAKP